MNEKRNRLGNLEDRDMARPSNERILRDKILRILIFKELHLW